MSSECHSCHNEKSRLSYYCLTKIAYYIRFANVLQDVGYKKQEIINYEENLK